jgi:hypothetical protein
MCHRGEDIILRRIVRQARRSPCSHAAVGSQTADVRRKLGGYVGHLFPEENQKSSAQTVIEIVPGEEDKSWNAGFYVIEKAPVPFEDSLRKLCKSVSRSV